MADTPQSLSFVLQADAISLPGARARVTSWLEQVAWPVRDLAGFHTLHLRLTSDD